METTERNLAACLLFSNYEYVSISNSDKGDRKVHLGNETIFFQEHRIGQQVPSLLFSLFLQVSNLFPIHRMVTQYSCQNQNLTKRSIRNSPVHLNNYMRAMLKRGSLKIDGKRNRGKLIHVGRQRMASVPPQKLPIACCRAPAIWCAHLICSPIVNNLQKHGCTGLLEKKKYRHMVKPCWRE